MAVNNFPLLLFSSPIFDQRTKGTARAPIFHRPGLDRQAERLAPKLAALMAAFQQRRFALQQIAPTEYPELVLVFEIAGSIQDFANAIAQIEGFEWLVEWEQEELLADPDFFDQEDTGKPIQRRLFLVASNQSALDQLLTLWNRYREDPAVKFAHGLARFKKLFENLTDLRFWSLEDRLGDDVRSYWEERLEHGALTISFEIEAWYYPSALKNELARQQVAARLTTLGGRIVSATLIPEIGYHGMLVEIPREAIAALLNGDIPELLLADQIMFFRPKAQSSTEPAEAVGMTTPYGAVPPQSVGPPVVALLDGLPQQNHPLLAGRLDVDDPDGWEPTYEAKDRVHGTAMASLILHGDLNASSTAVSRRLYVRPILLPDPDDFGDRRRECTPANMLLVDLMHRAIRRICEGEAGRPAVAPTVRVINLSIGNPARIFDREMSPCARLLDWLSFRYRVLFIVSAGNDVEGLAVDVPKAVFDELKPEERANHALSALLTRNSERRLLSPAESVNALTVGASHADESKFTAVAGRFDLFAGRGISPISRIGHGFRRAVKPDILMPGGRVLHLQRLVGSPETTRLDVVRSSAAPGQRVAMPTTSLQIDATMHSRGTSNATALASRAAVRAFDVIEALRAQGVGIPQGHDAVLLKALLVHGASWGELGPGLLASRPEITNDKRRDFIARCLGYGISNIDRALECAAERATLIGTGELKMDQALVFSAPLPPSLSAQKIWRRLIVTLAWLTPINPGHQAYRRAKLSITPPSTLLQVTRLNSVHDKAAQRGTVQHESLEGDAAVAFVDGDRLECKVNCMAPAGDFDESVPFALCLTLEVAQGTGISVYNEIRDRVAPNVQIHPNAG